MFELGKVIARARCNNQDSEAIEWYRRAAKAGYAPAIKMMKAQNVVEILGFFGRK